MSDIVKQWPNNIISGEIRYEKASNYDGFYLADAEHGIPTFGSVTATASPTIRDQHVRVFNYPGQTEAIASELVFRWNMHRELLSALKEARRMLWEMGCSENDLQPIRAAIVKAAAHAEQTTPTETSGTYPSRHKATVTTDDLPEGGSAALRRLDSALCNFINAYCDPYEPEEEYEAETSKNLAELSEAYNQAYTAGVFPSRSALSKEPGE